MKKIQFNQQVIDYSSYLRAVAIKLTYNTEQANDLVQETIYRALLNEEKFLGGNLKAWLTTIMKNLFINGIRSAKRRQKVDTFEINNYGFDGHINAAVPNSSEANLMMEEVQIEINKLHPDLKLPFLMRYQGFKYEEIAQRLGAPLGTIKSRIHIARKNLIRKLGNMYGTTHLAELAA